MEDIVKYVQELNKKRGRIKSQRSRAYQKSNIGKRTGKIIKIGGMHDTSSLFKSLDSSDSSVNLNTSRASVPVSVKSVSIPDPPAFDNSSDSGDCIDDGVTVAEATQIQNLDPGSSTSKTFVDQSVQHSPPVIRRTLVDQSIQHSYSDDVVEMRATSQSQKNESSQEKNKNKSDTSKMFVDQSTQHSEKRRSSHHQIKKTSQRNKLKESDSIATLMSPEDSSHLFEKIVSSRKSVAKSYGSPYIHEGVSTDYHSSPERRVVSSNNIIQKYTKMISATKSGSKMSYVASPALTPKHSQNSLLRRRLSFNKDLGSDKEQKSSINILQNREVSSVHPLFELDQSSSPTNSEIFVVKQPKEAVQNQDSSWLFSSPTASRINHPMLIKRKSSAKKESSKRKLTLTERFTQNRSSNTEDFTSSSPEKKARSSELEEVSLAKQRRSKTKQRLDFSDQGQNRNCPSLPISKERVMPVAKKNLNFSPGSSALEHHESTSSHKLQNSRAIFSSMLSQNSGIDKPSLVDYSLSDESDNLTPVTVKKKRGSLSDTRNKSNMDESSYEKRRLPKRRHSSQRVDLSEDKIWEDALNVNTNGKVVPTSRRVYLDERARSRIYSDSSADEELESQIIEKRKTPTLKKKSAKNSTLPPAGRRLETRPKKQKAKIPNSRSSSLHKNFSEESIQNDSDALPTGRHKNQQKKNRSRIYSDSSSDEEKEPQMTTNKKKSTLNKRKSVKKNSQSTANRKLEKQKNIQSRNLSGKQNVSRRYVDDHSDSSIQDESRKENNPQQSRRSQKQESNNETFSSLPDHRKKKSAKTNSRVSQLDMNSLRAWLDSGNSANNQSSSFTAIPPGPFKSPKNYPKSQTKSKAATKAQNMETTVVTDEVDDDHPPLPSVDESSINISVSRNRNVHALLKQYGPPSSTPRVDKRAKKRIRKHQSDISTDLAKAIDILHSDTDDSRMTDDTYCERKKPKIPDISLKGKNNNRKTNPNNKEIHVSSFYQNEAQDVTTVVDEIVEDPVDTTLVPDESQAHERTQTSQRNISRTRLQTKRNSNVSGMHTRSMVIENSPKKGTVPKVPKNILENLSILEPIIIQRERDMQQPEVDVSKKNRKTAGSGKHSKGNKKSATTSKKGKQKKSSNDKQDKIIIPVSPDSSIDKKIYDCRDKTSVSSPKHTNKKKKAVKPKKKQKPNVTLGTSNESIEDETIQSTSTQNRSRTKPSNRGTKNKSKRTRLGAHDDYRLAASLDIIIPPTNQEDDGLRRSKRVRMRPLKPGETKVLGERGELLGVQKDNEIIKINREEAGILHIESKFHEPSGKRRMKKANSTKLVNTKKPKPKIKKVKKLTSTSKNQGGDPAMSWFDDITAPSSQVSVNESVDPASISDAGLSFFILEGKSDNYIKVDASAMICNDSGVFGNSPEEPIYVEDGVWVTKGISFHSIVQGKLIIEPKKTKSSRIVHCMHMCFFLVAGSLELVIGGGNTRVTIAEDTYFRIPCRNQYSFYNPHDTIPAKMFFALVKVPDTSQDGI
ncbi:uncharacterized protein LOC120337808 [Styela clava]